MGQEKNAENIPFLRSTQPKSTERVPVVELSGYDLKTGGLVSAPNPYLDEFEWGAKEPSIELQFQSTTGYQAFVFDPEKAFNSKVL